MPIIFLWSKTFLYFLTIPWFLHMMVLCERSKRKKEVEWFQGKGNGRVRMSKTLVHVFFIVILLYFACVSHILPPEAQSRNPTNLWPLHFRSSAKSLIQVASLGLCENLLVTPLSLNSVSTSNTQSSLIVFKITTQWKA